MIWLLAHWRAVILSLLLAGLAAKAYVASSEVTALSAKNVMLGKALSAEETALNQEQQDVTQDAAIDKQYTQELSHAQSENARLRADVESGHRRLRVAADCPATAATNPTTTGVAHAGSPRLSDAAQRNYFTLRDRMSLADKQIGGLQAYIRRVCLAGSDGENITPASAG